MLSSMPLPSLSFIRHGLVDAASRLPALDRDSVRAAAGGALVFIAAYHLARTADLGLSNFLGQATVRHGTNPLSWLSIHLVGAQPAAGGTRIGGDHGNGFNHQNEGRFYVMLPGDWGQPSERPFWRRHSTGLRPWLIDNTMSRVIPRGYAGMACANLMTLGHRQQLGYAAWPLVGLGACLMPSIRIRVPDEELVDRSYWMPDSSHGGTAASTERWIHPLRIGTLGTVLEGASLQTPRRMLDHPGRVLTGICQLLLVAAIAYGTLLRRPQWVAANSTTLIAAAVFATL